MVNAVDEEVSAGPTKRFFVSMLTRDIELKDAIMDLLDNCVDGIQRQLNHNAEGDLPYKGFWAKISATPNSFSIEDNCGGIPKDVALKSAFVLGKDLDATPAKDLHTVGMYGIGMKRAIFKLGKDTTVYSRPKGEDNAFEVKISPAWLESTSWTLPLHVCEKRNEEYGTNISISQLNETIARSFDKDRSVFLQELAMSISQFYALIMRKGFVVYLNSVRVEPAPLNLMFSGKEGKGIDPYVFSASLDGVDVELTVGFRRTLASQQEQDEEADQPRSSNDAGWTVICNDRVVLYNDRTQVTGWGRGNVPRYHTQFISIGGVAVFRSSALYNLPLTTTKRGLDTDNFAYLTALDYMMEGLKKFTDFTNKWKGREEETGEVFFDAKSVPFSMATKTLLESNRASSVRKLGPSANAKRYIPDLPTPEDKNPKRKIIYSRPIEEIEKLTHFFFNGTDGISPADVGIKCFEVCLNNAVRVGE